MNPNLFLIGFQKCGSSSLFDFLIQHPEIQGTSKKETFALTDPDYEHYDMNNSVTNPDFTWRKYLDCSSPSSYYLEASVCNFYQNTAKEYIAKIQGAKVIFIVRNPTDRFISTYNYYGGSGVYLPPKTSIEEYYDFVLAKKSEKEAMNFALEHGKYCEFITDWQKIVGSENVLVLGMREVVENAQNTARVLCGFLNIEDKFPSEMSRKNTSKVIKNKGVHLFLRRVFGGKGLRKTWIAKIYKNWNQKKPPRSEISNELQDVLRNYYREEYSQLSNLF